MHLDVDFFQARMVAVCEMQPQCFSNELVLCCIWCGSSLMSSRLILGES